MGYLNFLSDMDVHAILAYRKGKEMSKKSL